MHSSREGSLTRFLFENIYCQCHSAAARPVPQEQAASFCRRCGKIVPEVNRKGSFTSYLFQAVRCDCAEPDEGPAVQTAHRPDLDARYTSPPGSPSSARLTRLKIQQASATMGSIKEIGLTGGDIIGDNYQIFELIGEGGMGLVFLGKHMQLNRTCAVKVLAPSMLSVSSWMMFQNEAKIIANLNHKSICQIYDLGVHKERLPFYAMDYLPGKTLEQLLAQQGTLSVGAVIEIFMQLAEGLAFAHGKGVIHRDIKPANIMLVPTDQSDTCVKLLDFGIAELARSSLVDCDREDIVGTAFYMSPERFAGTAGDCRCDIYAAGCSMFEALTGSLPYESEDLLELRRMHEEDPIPTLRSRTNTNFSPAIEAVIHKCLAKNVDDRYQTAEQLQADLSCILNEEPLLFASPEKVTIAKDLGKGSSIAEDEVQRNLTNSLRWTAIAFGTTAVAVSLFFILPVSKEKLVTSPPTVPFSVERDNSPLFIGDADLETSLNKVKLIEQQLKSDPTHLTLTGTALSVEETMAVSRANKLTSLKLRECRGDTKLFFERIAHLPIACLEIISSDIDDDGLFVLSNMKGLQTLHLRRCSKISDAGVAHLSRLPRLVQLGMSSVPGLTEIGIRDIHDGCKNIKLLNLTSNPLINKRCIDALSGSGVTTLYLDRTGISDESIDTMASMPNLVTLSIGKNHQITDQALPRLARIKQLNTLTIVDTSISGFSKDWKSLRNLQRLSVGASSVSKPAELEALKKMLPKECIVTVRASSGKE